MALPTISEILHVKPPAFVRKLRRKSDWGTPADPAGTRVTEATSKIFLSEPEGERPSLYLIETDDDLRRLAVAMNASRDSLIEEINFVAFSPDELRDAGIKLDPTVGTLKCHIANRRHFEAVGTASQFQGLCEAAMLRGREPGRYTRAMMKDVAKRAQEEGCAAATGQPQCTVGECAPPPPATNPG